MRTNEERIVVQCLCARRLVVGIIETYQRIAEEGRELPASLVNLQTSGGRLDHLRQVGSHLEIGMAVVVNAGSPLRSLAAGEDGTRHFELAQLAGQTDEPLADRLALCLLVQTLPQGEQSIERNQPLAVHYGTNPVGNFLVHPLGLGGDLLRPREQLDDLVLRGRGPAGSGSQHFPQRCPPGVEELGRGAHLVKRLDHLLPRAIQFFVGDLSLASQDLPDAHVRLEGTKDISAQSAVGSRIDRSRYLQELRHRGVA